MILVASRGWHKNEKINITMKVESKTKVDEVKKTIARGATKISWI